MSQSRSGHPVAAGWLSGAAYGGMFVFGIVMAVLGAILPVISERLHFDLSLAGELFPAMNGAMLITTLALGPALDRYGMKPAFVAAPLFVAAALALMAATAGYGGLMLAVTLLGAGGGALNQATNTLVANLHEDEREKNAALNLLGVFFGFGALFIPFTIGSLLQLFGLSAILYVGLFLSLIPAGISAVHRFPEPRQKQGVPPRQVIAFARQPLVIAFCCLLFFESGNEFVLGGYLSVFLSRNLGADVQTASYLLAAYWGALMLWRVVLSRAMLKISGERLILVSALGVAGSVVLLVFASSLPVAGAAMVLLGISISAIFPTTLGLAGARYASHAGTVFGLLIGIALLGGMTMPWIAGRLSERAGVGAGLSIAAFSAIAIFFLQLVIGKLTKRPTPATES